MEFSDFAGWIGFSGRSGANLDNPAEMAQEMAIEALRQSAEQLYEPGV